jgi:hypothetical protein
VNDEGAREAVLGLKKRPVFKVSKICEEYEAETKDQVLDRSPDQLRIWRNAENEWPQASSVSSPTSSSRSLQLKMRSISETFGGIAS